MPSHTIDPAPTDPAPRSYPPFVTLLRRGRFDRDTLGTQTASEVEAWLLADAADESDLLKLFQSFVWRMVAAGLPLDRAGLSIGTLHPQLLGYAWNWNSDDGLCDEVKVAEAVLSTDAYRRNPIFRVIEYGERFRTRLDLEDAVPASPLLAELAAQGTTEYVAMPLPGGADVHHSVTFATKQPGGFSEQQFSAIDNLIRLLALHVQRHIAVRISANVVRTYLAAAAGDQVLRGSIKRGSGESIDAIIWASDLRGFTDLAERLDFTVIGRAVNATSRVEGLSKTLGRPILLTKAVADLLDGPLDHLGDHALRGLSQPVAIFGPKGDS